MRTAVLGLDGATFDLIDPLIEAGRMPVIAQLIREGSRAQLRSTIYPNSFPGWASCTTGTSEGMHGIFSPFLRRQSSYNVRPISGRDVMTRTVWDLLSSQDGRSILVNIPTTYPPEPVNGYMVTGMLTPSIQSNFTYPENLREELLLCLPEYTIEPGRNTDKSARAREFTHAIKMHELCTASLMKKGDWDFLMVVFSVLDRVQHDFWADMDKQHPRYDPKISPEHSRFIFDSYEQLDSAVGRLIEKMPSDTRVFIVSDHGFCAELYEVRVNEVLAKAGLLAFKSGSTRKLRARIRRLGDKISRHREYEDSNPLDKKVRHGSYYLEEIDWARTRAFFAQDKGVWVNLAGREPEGVVDLCDYDSVIREIIMALSALTMGESGVKVFENVLSRKEAFSGRYADRLPDVIMIPADDQIVYNERPGYGEVIVPADSTTGTHSKNGVLIAWGPGIKAEKTLTKAPDLRDIAPTALYSLGCPITCDMDGETIMDLFEVARAPDRSGSSYKEVRSTKDNIYEDDEEASVEERLRLLGYIE